jgi:protein-disulfide isomerase
LLAFRHFPIESLHARAVAAGAAGHCAGKQKAFWQYHDAMFSSPTRLDDANLLTLAEGLGLEPIAFRTCLADPSSEGAVRSDIELGSAIGVTGTPTLLIGHLTPQGVKVSKVLTGAVSFPVIKKHLDEIITNGSSR